MSINDLFPPIFASFVVYFSVLYAKTLTHHVSDTRLNNKSILLILFALK